jgi:acetyl esterase/lipase
MQRKPRINTVFLGLVSILSFTIFLACRKNTTVARIPGGPSIQAISNVKYGSNKDWKGNNVDLLLDVYMPATGNSGDKFPLVFFVHGGGFSTGDKISAANYLKNFVTSGYVAVSINYRLGWNGDNNTSCEGDTTQLKEAGYRAIQDTRAALRFLVAHSAEYHIDTNYIFLNGNSAGAVTVLNSIFLSQAQLNMLIPGVQARLGGIDNADNALNNTYSIAGISAISGCVVDSNSITMANAVPLILFHGGRDETVPYNHGYAHNCPNMLTVDGSLSIYNRMAALGKPCVIHFDPSAGHLPYSDAFRFTNQLCFFNSILDERVESGYFQGLTSSCP